MSTTLLITTHNRAELLRTSLARLAELTLPDEVLVVDDGGADDTEAVCATFAEQSSRPLRYVYHNNPGRTICSTARNVGVRMAAGELIVTCEPELVFVTDAIAQLAELHAADPDRVISAGTIHHAANGTGWEQTVGQKPTAVGWVAPYVALYRREWIERVGGWDESFPGPWGWDDTDLLTRLRLCGIGQRIALEIRAVHQWHPLGSDENTVNEQHFLAKSFHVDEHDDADVVANQGGPWGILRTRSS